MADTGAAFVQFKKSSSKKRLVRAKVQSDSSGEEVEDEEINMSEFRKTKQLQKLRKRTAGTNIVTLALGKKVSKVEEDILDDPFNINSGGLVTGKDMKGYKPKEDAYDVGTQFYRETHIRDEDDEMRKFIDTEMEKVKGAEGEGGEEEDEEAPKYLSPEDAALQALPGHLTKSTFKKDQQMLSAQMLTGIPEVDLGIEVKIQNIERTERAKRDMLRKGTITTGEARNKNSSHERFTDMSGSLGSDGRFEPNMFGTASESVAEGARWKDDSMTMEQQEEYLRKEMLKSKQNDRVEYNRQMENLGEQRAENSFGADPFEASDDMAVKNFRAAEEAEKRKNGRIK